MINVLSQDSSVIYVGVKQLIRVRYNSRHVTDVPAKTFSVEQIWLILSALLEGKFKLLLEV